MPRLRSLLVVCILGSLFIQGCPRDPCPEPSEAVGLRFVSPQDTSLSITWEDSRYDKYQNCQRTDTFVITGVQGFAPSQLDRLLEEHIDLPDDVRGASIGPTGTGSDIRLTVSLYDRPGVASYDLTLTLDNASVTATIPLEN